MDNRDDNLLEGTSFDTPEVRSLAARTDPAVVQRVLELADLESPPFVDDDHVWMTGYVYGLLLKAGLKVHSGSGDGGPSVDLVVELPGIGRSVRLRVLPQRTPSPGAVDT